MRQHQHYAGKYNKIIIDTVMQLRSRPAAHWSNIELLWAKRKLYKPTINSCIVDERLV